MPVGVYVWKKDICDPYAMHVKEGGLKGDLRAMSGAGEALLRQLQFLLPVQKFGKSGAYSVMKRSKINKLCICTVTND